MYVTRASDGDDNTEYSCTSNMQIYVVQGTVTTDHKFVIELVGQQWIGQFTEVELQ